MAPALEMGSLRVEMVKGPWVCVLVADARSSGVGKGSLTSVMWFIVLFCFIVVVVVAFFCSCDYALMVCKVVVVVFLEERWLVAWWGRSCSSLCQMMWQRAASLRIIDHMKLLMRALMTPKNTWSIIRARLPLGVLAQW